MKHLLTLAFTLVLNSVHPQNLGLDDTSVSMQEHQCKTIAMQAYALQEICKDTYGSSVTFTNYAFSHAISPALQENSTYEICDYYTNDTVNYSAANSNSSLIITLCSTTFAFLYSNAKNCTDYYCLDLCDVPELEGLYIKFFQNSTQNCKPNPALPECAREPDTGKGDNGNCPIYE